MVNRKAIQSWIRQVPQQGKTKYYELLKGFGLYDIICDYMVAAYAYLRARDGSVSVESYREFALMNYRFVYEGGVQEFVKGKCAEMMINGGPTLPLILCSGMKHLELDDAAVLAQVWKILTRADNLQELLDMMEEMV